MISVLITDIREKCKMTDEEIIKEGLTQMDLKKVRDFCGLSDKEMKKVLRERIEGIEKKKKTGGDNDVGVLSYGCWYNGYNTVPSYGDLELSSATCSWHDYDKPYSCKVERGVACLWGCTNNDPNLGWHKTQFSNQSALENYIYSRGYHRTAGYAVGRYWQEYADADYTRAISSGYRHQVSMTKLSDGSGRVEAHTEGPEPNPEMNWYGLIMGFWPNEVEFWHNQC